MATLPTDSNATPNYTAAQHATHHNTIHGLWNLLTTKGDLIVATAAQVFARLGVGADGQVLTADSTQTAGVKWAAAGGGGGTTITEQPTPPGSPTDGQLWIDTDAVATTAGVRDFDVRARTAGDLTGLTSSSYANVDTAIDLVVVAAPNDILEIGLQGRSDNTGYLVLNGHTWVSGAAVNSIYGATVTGDGPPSWGIGGNGVVNLAGGCLYAVQSGDVSGGTVTLRLRYKTNGTRTIYSNTNSPLQWWAKNLGPNV